MCQRHSICHSRAHTLTVLYRYHNAQNVPTLPYSRVGQWSSRGAVTSVCCVKLKGVQQSAAPHPFKSAKAQAAPQGAKTEGPRPTAAHAHRSAHLIVCTLGLREGSKYKKFKFKIETGS